MESDEESERVLVDVGAQAPTTDQGLPTASILPRRCTVSPQATLSLTGSVFPRLLSGLRPGLSSHRWISGATARFAMLKGCGHHDSSRWKGRIPEPAQGQFHYMPGQRTVVLRGGGDLWRC